MKLPFSRRTLAFIVIILAVAVSRGIDKYSDDSSSFNATNSDISLLTRAYAQQQSNLWVTIQAKVVRTLPDDRKGDQHQRFIIDPGFGFSVLVAHNIDIAPRVPVRAGDSITLRGEYEWTNKGGVLHWTHHDPGGRRQGGWIEYREQRYQ